MNIFTQKPNQKPNVFTALPVLNKPVVRPFQLTSNPILQANPYQKPVPVFGLPKRPTPPVSTATANTTRQMVAPVPIQSPTPQQGGNIFLGGTKISQGTPDVSSLQNSALAKIPLLGKLLTGTGEKGNANLYDKGTFAGSLERQGALGFHRQGFKNATNPDRASIGEQIYSDYQTRIRRGDDETTALNVASQNIFNQKSPNFLGIEREVDKLKNPNVELTGEQSRSLAPKNLVRKALAVLDVPGFGATVKPVKAGLGVLEVEMIRKSKLHGKGTVIDNSTKRIVKKVPRTPLAKGVESAHEAGKEGQGVLESFLTPPQKPKGLLTGSKGLPPTAQNQKVSPLWVNKIGTSIREKVQDNWVRVKNLQEQVGTDINTKTLTPYQAETLMHGRVQARLDSVNETLKTIDKEVLTLEKLDTQARKKIDLYLTAKHAPERNAIHGNKAAGMTNEEAKTILSELDDAGLQKVGDKMKALNDQTLEILKEGQVISQETFDTLRKNYQNHVPLQRIMDETDLNQYLSSGGLDVRSSGLKRAKGSEREVSDILTNIAANLEQAIVRSEKNRVNLATLKFAREHKDLGVFEEVKAKIIGKTVDGKPLLEKIEDPNVLTVMENGKPVHLLIKDEKLALAFKATGQEKLPALFNFISGFTRLYSGLATRFNPEFVFSNKLRDLQEMAVYMAAQDGVGFKGAGKTLARDPVSMADVIAGMAGKNTKGGKLYRQMIEDGGTTGGMSLSTRKQLEIDIEDIRSMNRAGILNPKQAGKKFLKSIDAWNEVFENSTRLSAYKTALDNGMTRDQAAFIAKNATINFNKKGTAGPIINALYMFSNASIQGTTKLLTAMKNPKVAATVTATVGSSVWATNSWNDKVDPDWREKVSPWDREANLIVMLPGEEGAKYITLPVSWGLKPMKVMADYAYDAAHGKAKQADGFDVAGNVLGSLWNAYNPVGGSSLGSSLMPTIGDVPYDISTNKKWSGSKIHPDSKDGVPESENFFNKKGVPSDQSKTFGMLKTGAEKVSGVTNGRIELNPASMKYALDSYLSGAGRAVSGTIETSTSLIKGKELQTNETPFLRRFYKEKTEAEIETAKKFEAKDALRQELKKLSPEDQAKRIQEHINNLPEDQRKGITYGLSQEGFTTKGVSTSDRMIKGRALYDQVQQLINEGKQGEAQRIASMWTTEQKDAYGAVKSSESTKRTEIFKELLDGDPQKAVEYARSLRPDQQENLKDFLTRKGNEEWMLKYQSGK